MSSITDNGTGDYTDKNKTAMANINYAPCLFSIEIMLVGLAGVACMGIRHLLKTTTTVRSSHLNASNVLEDPLLFAEP
jgi:hypothetical protein